MLIISTVNVAAEADPTDDLYRQIPTDTGLTYEPYSGNKSYIDITDISYSIDGSQVTLTMTLADDILSSPFVKYYMHFRTSDAPLFTATFSDGFGSYTGPNNPAGAIIDNPVSGNMFTAIFDVNDPNLNYIAWAEADEYTDEINDQVEGWRDFAPDSYAPWSEPVEGNGDDDDNGDTNGEDDENGGDTGGNGSSTGTPGFEVITVIIALGVAFILLRRKK